VIHLPRSTAAHAAGITKDAAGMFFLSIGVGVAHKLARDRRTADFKFGLCHSFAQRNNLRHFSTKGFA
jgi:hypothetical protein